MTEQQKVAADEKYVVIAAEPSYLNVCLCPCEHSQCYTSQTSIPLKHLVSTLEDYVGQHGGPGQLQIALYYKDGDGTIKPLIPDEQQKPEHDR